MYRHYTVVRSVPRKLRAIEGFSHKGESVKRGSTVYISQIHVILLLRISYSFRCTVFQTCLFKEKTKSYTSPLATTK